MADDPASADSAEAGRPESVQHEPLLSEPHSQPGAGPSLDVAHSDPGAEPSLVAHSDSSSEPLPSAAASDPGAEPLNSAGSALESEVSAEPLLDAAGARAVGTASADPAAVGSGAAEPKGLFSALPPIPRMQERTSLRWKAWIALAFLVPCAVIALSLWLIVRGNPAQAVLPGLPSTATPNASSSASAAEPGATEVAEPEAADSAAARSLENPHEAEVTLPGFEDEGNDESPTPSKRTPPKHFATVQEAAAGSCSTESVDGLSRQIIDQARCLKPNEVVPLPKRANLLMAPHVYPYLELAARDHLLKALDSNAKTTMTINSCLRTVAQQYLVSRWSVSKSCGVQLATAPGESNHEIGTALDIAEAGKWRAALESQEFRWLGSSDRVHFDFKGGTSSAHTAVDVLAFQKLWNANHKDDLITETGRYDSATEQRLKRSPPAGFPIGASCTRGGARAH